MSNVTTSVRASCVDALRGLSGPRNSLTAYLLAVLLIVPASLMAQPTTNGRLHGDGDNTQYNLQGVSTEGSGYLFTYAGPDSIYGLMRVDPSFNDNVFGDSKNGGADVAYVDSVNWPGTRGWKSIYNSDYNEWHMECGSEVYQWKQDYLADADGDKLPRQAAGGEADYTSDNTTDAGDGTQPPGLVSASSMQWNMNHSTWDITLGGTRTDWDTYKSPIGLPTTGYPLFDPATNWEWAMIYEIAFPRSVCGPDDILVWVVSAHNSPVKDGNADIPVCDPEVFACDVLPVELVDFSAIENAGDIQLTWSTASETNNVGFSIEHAGNGGIFEEVGFVAGAGTSTDWNEYGFRFESAEPGRHSFRLRQVDLDGSFTFSSSLEVFVELPGQFLLEQAYPNPFNPSTTIRFVVAEASPVTMTMYDISGRAVRSLYSGTPDANEMNIVEIDAADLPSGVYLVRLVGASFVGNRTITLSK